MCAAELPWLNHVKNSLHIDVLNKEHNLSWSSYHSAKLEKIGAARALTALLPLFRDQAHTPAMIYHAMVLIQKQIEYLNPGQIPIMTVDQPLFAIAKEIQWLKPECLGEDKFLVMMGDLHIEMAFMKCLGDWLEGSGWMALLSLAEITTSGKADSMLSGSSNITLCRYLHKVTASALHIKKKEAYSEYLKECTEEWHQVPLHEKRMGVE